MSFKGFKAKDLCDTTSGGPHDERFCVSVAAACSGSRSPVAVAGLSPRSASEAGGGPGWGKAKSIILVYLQGGPSHLDLWDPKENVPDNVKSVFNPISTQLPGIQFTENLPNLSQINDKLLDDPVDVLHAKRIVQSHRRDLSDDDRLHDRQGQPVWSARAAVAEGLPQLR